MDKKEIVSSILLVLSNSLAISSIGTPSWVENSFAGILLSIVLFCSNLL